MTIPPEAIEAAEQAIRARYTITGPDVDRRIASVMSDVRTGLTAAAPKIAAAERMKWAAVADEHAGQLMQGGGCGSDAEALWHFSGLLRAEP